MRTILSIAAALALVPPALADPIVVDGDPPVVGDLHLSPRHALHFSVSEYALVHVTIRHSGDRVATLQQAFMPGTGRMGIAHGLRPGSYTATVTANDVAHNVSPAQVVRFRVS
jgi:hypothetical protein